MIVITSTEWKLAAGIIAAVIAALVVWFVRRHRPTQDELERIRRGELARTGRLVDGMLLDICEMEGKDGSTRTMLIYTYRISGVDYECSQDITTVLAIIPQGQLRAGFPCTVRFSQRSPQDSIVIAEGWSGLRANKSDLPAVSDMA